MPLAGDRRSLEVISLGEKSPLAFLSAVLATALPTLVTTALAEMGTHHLQLLATLVLPTALCHDDSPQFELRGRKASPEGGSRKPCYCHHNATNKRSTGESLRVST